MDYQSLLGLTSYEGDSIKTQNLVAENAEINNLIIPPGAGVGKILTSDADGVATWQDPEEAVLIGDADGPLDDNVVSTLRGGTISIPIGTDTVCLLNQTQTLTSKTLTAPIISTIVNTGTLTLPTSTDTLVGKATADILTNKTIQVFSNGSAQISMPAGSATSRVLATLTGIETFTGKTLTLPVITSISNVGTMLIPTGGGTLATIAGAQTLTNKTLILPVIESFSNYGTMYVPSGGGTLATIAGAQTLTNKTISGATSISTTALTLSTGAANLRILQSNASGVASWVAPPAVVTAVTMAGDCTGNSATNQVNTLLNGAINCSNLVQLTASQTLTNKTLTFPAISTISNGGTVSFPVGNHQLVSDTSSSTLSNKTLNFPICSSISNSGTVTLPTGFCTLATLASVETFTNKTLSAPVINGITSFSNSSAGVITVPTGATARTLVTWDGTETLSAKTLSAPVITGITSFSNSSAGVITVPTGASARTLATWDGTETLSGKTLTAPIITGTCSFTTGLTLPTTGGTASTLDYYEEATHATTFTGPYTTLSLTFHLTRIGKLVTCNMVGNSTNGAGAVANYFQATTLLPARFRPSGAVDLMGACNVKNGATWSLGTFHVNSGGNMWVYPVGWTSTFTATATVGNVGFGWVTISWRTS